jgi:hypothetical protein
LIDELVKLNSLLAQVWYADHEQGERNYFPEDANHDIINVDKERQGRDKS